MAPKPQQAELSPPKEKPKPIATTYYPLSTGKEWQVWQVDVYKGEDGKTRTEQAPVYSHGSLVVARQRLMVLLDGVLP